MARIRLRKSGEETAIYSLEYKHHSINQICAPETARHKNILDHSLINKILYHEDIEKRKGVWCGGARETREPRVTIG